MNCIEYIENYYFVYGTNNCYDIDYAENNIIIIYQQINNFINAFVYAKNAQQKDLMKITKIMMNA